MGVTGRGMGDSKDTVLTAEKERAEGPGDVFAEGSGSTTLNPNIKNDEKVALEVFDQEKLRKYELSKLRYEKDTVLPPHCTFTETLPDTTLRWLKWTDQRLAQRCTLSSTVWSLSTPRTSWTCASSLRSWKSQTSRGMFLYPFVGGSAGIQLNTWNDDSLQ